MALSTSVKASEISEIEEKTLSYVSRRLFWGMRNFSIFAKIKFSPLLSSIFLISFLLRILKITVPLNIDEVSWLSRGTLFFKFLFEGNLADTFLRHHPGVTNMWLYGSGMLLNCGFNQLFPGWLDMKQSTDLAGCLNKITPWEIPISLYVVPRLLQAVITSACMVAIYVLAKRLLGQTVALVAIVLLILEPFFLGYQRLLTTDALQADLSVLGLLLLLLYLRGDSDRRFLIASGALMGLATAAKIPTLFILPGVAMWIILIELGLWQTNFRPRGWKRQIIDMCLWLMTISTIMYLIWPAMWVAPLETLNKLQGGLSEEADIGHLFFLGEVTDSPGLVFYPLVLAYRLSPAVQVGLLVCFVVLLVPKLRSSCKKTPELMALVLVTLCVLVFLSSINRKYDRYLLLAYPELILLAGAGWISLFVWVKRNRKLQQLLPPWMGCTRGRTTKDFKRAILMVGLQIIVLVSQYPYYLTYYNPLLGGTKVAQNVFMMGQGEGLERVAYWLNQLPQPKNITVASWYAGALVPYFQGQVLDFRDEPNNLIQANRVVDYINGIQRQWLQPYLFSYFKVQKPLYQVSVHGVDYARVYPGVTPLLEDLKHIQFPLSFSFGDQVSLLGYDAITSEIKPGEDLIVAFYWKFLHPLPPQSKISLSLRDLKGPVGQSSQTSLLNEYCSLDKISSGTVLRDVHRLKTESNLKSGHYQIALEWLVPDKEKVLEVRDSKGNLQGKQAIIGDVDLVNF